MSLSGAPSLMSMRHSDPFMVELEARAILVVERCLTWRANKTVPALPQSGGLAPWQVRRAYEMLDTLDETTSLAALATPFRYRHSTLRELSRPALDSRLTGIRLPAE